MFRIKICGVRAAEDVRAAEPAGADCIGLNFYPPSVRYLQPDAAALLVQNTSTLQSAGVFVNEPVERIQAIAETVKLDWVQLHGDETLQTGSDLIAAGLSVIRAVRLPTTQLTAATIDAIVLPWAEIGARILLDADGGPQFGGSGQRLDWDGIGRWAAQTSLGDWILAGGLNPDNVGDAILRSRAAAVDVASGTESAPGQKDPAKIAAFVDNAKAAWA
ncbi:phosphoribosylanthranilate isomerase [Rosistilla oblonga]|uniref:phosphoribosylanthranilate isomerase n=1 Tax=Rosistilla oblonga TaxID=2527990 RepID=UPI003A980033